jgi:6-phosphofructokinase 1
VVFERLKGKAYRIRYNRAELSDVARHTKDMPRSFINRAGNNILDKFRDYALPLVGDLPVIGKIS